MMNRTTKMGSRWLQVALAALIAGAWAVDEAEATAMLSLDDGVTIVTITDNLAGDSNPTVGAIRFSGALGGGWVFNVATGVTKPLIGSPSVPRIDLSTENLGEHGTLIIRFTDTDFTAPVSGFQSSILAAITNVSSTIEWDTFLDSSNTPFGTATLLGGGVHPFTSDNVLSSNVPSASPYSLTVRLELHGQGEYRVFSNLEALALPEPGSLILLGAGLVEMALLRSRRSKRSTSSPSSSYR